MKTRYKILLTTVASLSLLMCKFPLTSSAKNTNKINGPQEKLSINKLSINKNDIFTIMNQHHKHSLITLKKHIHRDSNNYNMSKDTNDYNQNDIGNMNHFIKERAPYHYKQIGGNTRDLGGYITKNHKYQIKPDRIIRSADLQGTSKIGIKDLQKLHVDKIIDLRYKYGKNGIQGHPDPNELHSNTLKGTNIKYQDIPVYSYNEVHKITHYMKDNNIKGEYYYYGNPYTSNQNAIKTYRKVFRDLLNNKHGAILIHCNLGRDRTGVTSALILSALGIDKNTIFHDYLLTDHYHYKYHGIKPKPYSKQAGELKHFFNTINNKYGNVNHYLHKEIGLNNNDIYQLRSMYLQPIHEHNKYKTIKLYQFKHHKNYKKNTSMKMNDSNTIINKEHNRNRMLGDINNNFSNMNLL